MLCNIFLVYRVFGCLVLNWLNIVGVDLVVVLVSLSWWKLCCRVCLLGV